MRIYLMLIIICGHLAIYCGKLDELGTVDYYIANIIRSFCVFAVNAFVLLSGYFGVSFNPRKAMRISLKVILYTYCFYALSLLLGLHQLDILQDVQFLFPITTKKYWFITIYFTLCLFSPYLNTLLKTLTQKELKRCLILGFIIFYVVATFCFAVNASQIVTDAGYGFLNFIYLYCLGFYIRHYYTDIHSARFYLRIYILISVLLFLANHFMTSIFGFYYISFISYNTVFVLIGSIALFMFFKNLNIETNPFLNSCASRSFFVYILHMAPYIPKAIFSDLLMNEAVTGFNLMIALIGIPFIVYAICWLLDYFADFLLIPLYRLFDKLPNDSSI